MTLKTRLAKIEIQARPLIEAQRLEAWNEAMAEFTDADLEAIVNGEADRPLLARFEKASECEMPQCIREIATGLVSDEKP